MEAISFSLPLESSFASLLSLWDNERSAFLILKPFSFPNLTSSVWIKSYRGSIQKKPFNQYFRMFSEIWSFFFKFEAGYNLVSFPGSSPTGNEVVSLAAYVRNASALAVWRDKEQLRGERGSGFHMITTEAGDGVGRVVFFAPLSFSRGGIGCMLILSWPVFMALASWNLSLDQNSISPFWKVHTHFIFGKR